MRAIARCAMRPRSRRSIRRARRSSTTSCAISVSAARSCRRSEKARFKAVQEELAQLSSRFDDNVLDATNDWALHVTDEHELAGIPPDVVAEARAAAAKENREGWTLTLRMPCYLPVMQYADSRTLRATLHRAFATRASEVGVKPEWDNTPIIADILKLRHEAATLLGYGNFAEVSLVPKMAATADEVLAFLRDLARRARPFAREGLRRARGVRTRGARPRRAAGLGCRVRVGEAQGEAVRILRAGSAAVLSRAGGARGALPRRASRSTASGSARAARRPGIRP